MENREDFISNKSKVINDATNKAITTIKGYTRPKTIAAVLEMAVAMVVIMGVQFVMFNFDWTAWTHYIFWVRTFATSIGIYLLYRAVINYRFYKTSRRPNVVKAKDEYEAISDCIELSLKEFLKEFNLRSKVTAYVDKQNAKIYKIENKLIRCTNPNKRARLEIELAQLKKTIEPDFIERNIDAIHIKYYIVYTTDFADAEAKNNANTNLTRGNQAYNRLFNMKSIKNMWMYLVGAATLAVSLIGAEDMGALQIIVNIIGSLFMIITRVCTALMQADSIYDDTITVSIINKTNILREYKVWKETHPTETEIQRITKKIEEQFEKDYKDKQELLNQKLQEVEAIRVKLKNLVQ